MEGVLVIGDFAENYSFVLQDTAQGFHWNNSQATIHPFVIYHRFPLPANKNTNLKTNQTASLMIPLQYTDFSER